MGSTIPNIHLRLYKTTKSNNLKFRSTNKRHLPKCPPGSSLLTSPLTVATFATFPILIRLFELVIAQAALALATALAAPEALADTKISPSAHRARRDVFFKTEICYPDQDV